MRVGAMTGRHSRKRLVFDKGKRRWIRAMASGCSGEEFKMVGRCAYSPEHLDGQALACPCVC